MAKHNVKEEKAGQFDGELIFLISDALGERMMVRDVNACAIEIIGETTEDLLNLKKAGIILYQDLPPPLRR